MIRVAIIGLGQRGQATMQRLGYVSDITVTRTCDRDQDWHETVSAPDVDLVWICTPWEWHATMAVESMQMGKDVALEVPAVMTLDECATILRVSKETGRHCIILENCCYDTWHLGAKEMVRQGLVGRIKHLEGAYAHQVDEGWMRDRGRRHAGNPYPTHAFAPMCQFLDADDCPDVLVSLSSPTPGDHTNSSLIGSRKGVSMYLHYDVSTPRPYSRMQTVCGTLGFLQKYPVPTVQLEIPKSRAEVSQSTSINLCGDEAVAYVEGFIPEKYKALIAEGTRMGVSNVMNYMMDCRIAEVMEEVMHCRQMDADEPRFDMDTREAALWSSIVELTKKSVESGSAPVKIPSYDN